MSEENKEQLVHILRRQLTATMGNMGMPDAIAGSVYHETARKLVEAVQDNAHLVNSGGHPEAEQALKDLVEATEIAEGLDPDDLAQAPDDADIDFPAQGCALWMLRRPLRVYKELGGKPENDPDDTPSGPTQT